MGHERERSGCTGDLEEGVMLFEIKSWWSGLSIRQSIWQWSRSGMSPGQILPWWRVAFRVVLFPIDSFYWRYSQRRGYDVITDTWNLYGVRCSGRELRELFVGRGRILYVHRHGDKIVLSWNKNLATEKEE